MTALVKSVQEQITEFFSDRIGSIASLALSSALISFKVVIASYSFPERIAVSNFCSS